ncbi:mycofactocin dehydrogenase MftG [Mycolicibacterium hodleri]|uniref:Mycofactocin system GMC family oxidoreductase MftG n=1 Tax=Mycolicibacterium hodleri TaxID=49897 RepID=A0A502EAF3_9MYCO|nr:mycofactocin system GMC family oxidoreductase MftG [Mycolicibacterium hodleri]TPG34334.1 mycofactocin system GMC family oxidoreductase MftG [Mycolicibacterium hodleri]
MHSDVLIVGAGSAGCVLAESLSRDPRCEVTIVESGPGTADPFVREQIGNGHRLPIGSASSVIRRYETTLTDEPRRHASIMRGAVVGGSGAVNGGYFCRGLASDFDGWKLPGWSWDDVLPHFRDVETDLDFDGPLHGADGPMRIRRITEFEEGALAFVDAALGGGYEWVADLNGDDPGRPGVGPVPLNIDRGTRVGPGDAFLGRAAGRPNLTVLEKRRVTRIRFAGRRAVGVDSAGDDELPPLTADRIVLSAGAIESAHLLMVSGVGPAAQLSSVGIPVLVDLPVGTRSIDHPEWVLPVDWPAAPGRPPLEALLTTEQGLEIRCYTTGFATMAGADFDPSDRPHLGVTLMRPHSRGRMAVRSADVEVPPLIEHHYDSAPVDVAALEAGAELAHDLAGSGYEARESFWSTSQHLCGTVPMGPDGEAPLDERCRVRGVDGLWVVDGSVLPDITSRGPHATIVMIGHRAAEFIR